MAAPDLRPGKLRRGWKYRRYPTLRRLYDKKRTAVSESHRFGSFAPIREGNKVKWYVDALDYLWAVSIALEEAKEVIYIEDWWLSP